jgi:hypothetical protein
MDGIRKFMGLAALVTTAAFVATGCSPMEKKKASTEMGASSLALSGAQEVPPVSSGASGKSTIKVGADRSVNGSVMVSGMAPTAAHIHSGARGTNGPVIIPLTKTADNTFVAPPNTKLTDDQYASYKAGNLYVNVHSAAYPAGEVRGQLGAK